MATTTKRGARATNGPRADATTGTSRAAQVASPGELPSSVASPLENRGGATPGEKRRRAPRPPSGKRRRRESAPAPRMRAESESTADILARGLESAQRLKIDRQIIERGIAVDLVVRAVNNGAELNVPPAIARDVERRFKPKAPGRRPLPLAGPFVGLAAPSVRARIVTMLKLELESFRARVDREQRRARDLPPLRRLSRLADEELAQARSVLAARPPSWSAEWLDEEIAELERCVTALQTATRILEARAISPLGRLASVESNFVFRMSPRFDDDSIAAALYPGVDRESALARVRQNRSAAHRRLRKADRSGT